MAAVAKEKDVGEIICGLPVNADGSDSIQTEKTLKFIYALQEISPVPVYCEDERFTSLQAHQTLHEEGLEYRKHKKNVDSIAASFILDGYLASRNH